MSGINKVILIGRLGQDPVVRYTQTGGAVANLSIATSETWKDKEGQKQEQTEWHKVVFFSRLAEVAEEYLKKGSKVYVEGKLKTRKWEKDGVEHYTTEIMGSALQMLDSKGGEQSHEDQSASKGEAYDKTKYRAPVKQETFDDDVPF